MKLSHKKKVEWHIYLEMTTFNRSGCIIFILLETYNTKD